MGLVRGELIGKLWHGIDPFDGFPADAAVADLQGWASQHRYLSEAMDSESPAKVVEIGVWKGASVVTMAKRMKELNLDGVVLAVDTWLGAYEHWLGDFFGDLKLDHGYPTLYKTFAVNMLQQGVADYVLPLPVDSLNASVIAEQIGFRPDVIHVDGGHSYASVMADLHAWWPLIKPGGLYIGDDYFMDGVTWPGVKRATDEFFADIGITDIENEGGKCRVRKPA